MLFFTSVCECTHNPYECVCTHNPHESVQTLTTLTCVLMPHTHVCMCHMLLHRHVRDTCKSFIRALGQTCMFSTHAHVPDMILHRHARDMWMPHTDKHGIHAHSPYALLHGDTHAQIHTFTFVGSHVRLLARLCGGFSSVWGPLLPLKPWGLSNVVTAPVTKELKFFEIKLMNCLLLMSWM